MSDEIDIEEHDVLDDPNIRRIFPDLSLIKKEILQYEDGESLTTLHEPIQEETINSTLDIVPSKQEHVDYAEHVKEETKDILINHKLDFHQRHKKFFDSLSDDMSGSSDIISRYQPDTDTLFKDSVSSSSQAESKQSSETFETTDNNIRYVQNNVYVIGSKPCNPTSILIDNRNPKVVLENVSRFLNRCETYCKNCFILFPNIDEFVSHNTKMHSLKAVRSIRNKRNIGLKAPVKKFQCNICTICLSSRSNLYRHVRMVHKNKPAYLKSILIRRGRKKRRKSNTFPESNTLLKLVATECKTQSKKITRRYKTEVTSNKDVNTNVTEHNCFHCQKIFDSRTTLIEHLYDVIQPNKTGSNNSNKTEQVINSQDDKDTDSNKKNVSRSIECTLCPMKFSTQIQLDQHNREKHFHNKTKSHINNKYSVFKGADEFKLIIQKNADHKKCHSDDTDTCDVNNDSTLDSHISSNKKGRGDNTETENSAQLISNNLVYQCFICSQYFVYLKQYTYHMDNHNIKDLTQILNFDKVQFQGQCKLCPLKKSTIKSYNIHLFRYHKEKTKIKLHKLYCETALKSVLFKCLTCDIYFLSANAAKDHSNHKHIGVNWRCLDCKRTFKINDKKQHMKQHSLSKIIVAYSLDEAALDRVLYKCLKCAVHFGEKEYFLHFTECDKGVPNSVYCKTCDILINENDMSWHEDSHKNKKFQSFDFTCVESDILIKQQSVSDNPFRYSKFALTFCYGCNLFLRYSGTLRSAHVEGRCKSIFSRICNKCGLAFTYNGYESHKLVHNKVKKLDLQSFYFYDVTSKQQIRPPIPEYPSCENCKVHFVDKRVLKKHVCHVDHCIVCNICNKEFSEKAYQLHKKFHDYSLLCTALNRKRKTKAKLEDSLTVINTSSASMALSNEVLNMSQNINMMGTKYLYTCVSCDITVDLYDRVVQHCHDHYDNEEHRTTKSKLVNSRDKYDGKSVVIIMFDPFYFRFDSKIWIKHIFTNLKDEQVRNILDVSIYKFEHRLKMEEIQSGTSNVVLYKCDMCKSHINPDKLYFHARSTCAISEKQPCVHCGLNFYSASYRKIHEKVHEPYNATRTSYKIILFNKPENQPFTNMMVNASHKYVLYQCRNCEGIVDKLLRNKHQCCKSELRKCSTCGLLFPNRDYSSHTAKHEEFPYFKPEQMVIIFFGKSSYQKDNRLKPSFNGTIYDLTFYKCTSCQLCFNSENDTFEHQCEAKSIKSECTKCYLSFSKADLKEHIKLHGILELQHDDFLLNIITFIAFQTPNEEHLNTEEAGSESIKQNKNMEKENENKHTKTKLENIYKCSCELNFISKGNAQQHYKICNPKTKNSRQRCLKCNLYFTPRELFDHLLKHHSSNKIQYSYNIISLAKEKERDECIDLSIT